MLLAAQIGGCGDAPLSPALGSPVKWSNRGARCPSLRHRPSIRSFSVGRRHPPVAGIDAQPPEGLPAADQHPLAAAGDGAAHGRRRRRRRSDRRGLPRPRRDRPGRVRPDQRRLPLGDRAGRGVALRRPSRWLAWRSSPGIPTVWRWRWPATTMCRTPPPSPPACWRLCQPRPRARSPLLASGPPTPPPPMAISARANCSRARCAPRPVSSKKPDAELAEVLLAEGCLWNSGNFVFHAATMIEGTRGRVSRT